VGARHAVLIGVAAVLGGCAGPLSALDPAGPAAGGILQIFLVLMAIAVPSFIVIIGLFALSFKDARGRRVPVRLFLIGGGLVFPIAALSFVTVYGVILGEKITAAGVTPALRVEARAQQWRWHFTRETPTGPVTRADILDIPAGAPVEVIISSADVIHSFWVPRLGGKMDAVPGSRNRMVLRADNPGTYRGVCAEFCGTGHTAMGFTVEAHDPAAWAALTAGRTP
jgi:heme/copper-type cytochrome/quinol oxidase subunit 2